MEDRLEAALAGGVRGALDAVDEQPPAGLVQRERRVLAAAARVGDPLRPARVAQHRAGAGHAPEEIERRVQLGRSSRPGR